MLKKKTKTDYNKASLSALRAMLGSVDLSDIEEKDVSETERRAYCAAISAVFPRLEKDMKRLLHAQLMFSANQALDWEQVIFGRGSYNGIDILLNHWRAAHAEHNSRSIPVSFEKHEPFGTVTDL